MADQYRNLDTVRKLTDPRERLVAVIEYMDALEAKRTQAMVVRNRTIREVDMGPAEIARLTGLSVSTVKNVRMPR